MIVAKYFVEFIFYSFLGWVWESVYCTAKQKQWQDRGFLFGPICPIYGSSVVGLMLIFQILGKLGIHAETVPTWLLFIGCMIGSAFMEFFTSWILEKRFHARWWDYSELPLNIQGRIALPVSIGFGLAGVAIIRYLVPAVSRTHNMIPELVYEVLAILLAGLAGADLALTEASLSSLLVTIEAYKSEFNERAEKTYEAVSDMPGTLKSAEQRLKSSASAYVGKLTFMQRHILMNIKSFTKNPQDSGFFAGIERHPGKRLKDALMSRRKKNDDPSEDETCGED